MAETQNGGAYRVGDETVNANGDPVKVPKKANTESETKEPPPAPTAYVDGINFASDAAGEAAKAAGLTAADFEGYTASGQEGYTKPDVAKVIASKVAAQ